MRSQCFVHWATMEIDFDHPLQDLKGEPIRRTNPKWMRALSEYRKELETTSDPEVALGKVVKRLEEDNETLTLGDAVAEALTLTKQATEAGAKSKRRRYRLAMIATQGGKHDIDTKKDIGFIDDALAQYLGAVAYGHANTLLYPGDKDSEAVDEDDD